ncbi:MAG: hypothetical protein WBM41_04925 [Arenicellales bacterium]
MDLIQDALQWLYIAICFVLIWYGISLLLELGSYLLGKRGARQILRPLIKLIITALLAKAVVWLGAATSL